MAANALEKTKEAAPIIATVGAAVAIAGAKVLQERGTTEED